jgi:hypothetical protein
MTIKKLTKMPYAQAHIEILDDGTIVLVSYATRVAQILPNGWLTVYGLYSMTTRRHISAFMGEYGNGCDYATAKMICTDKMVLNIYTGEVIDWG